MQLHGRVVGFFLSLMAKNSYAQKLKHPSWQRMRLLIFERDNWRCGDCGSCEKELHAHHIEYIDGRNPWEYDYEQIITLCHECHKCRHTPGEASYNSKTHGWYGWSARVELIKEAINSYSETRSWRMSQLKDWFGLEGDPNYLLMQAYSDHPGYKFI
jgi:hypothetical protein